MTAANGLAQANTLATHVVLSLWLATSSFLIILISLIALLFFFARYVGRGPFVALLLSFYAAYALYSVFPYASFPAIPPTMALLVRLGLYAAFVFVFYVIMQRVMVSDFFHIGFFGLIVLSFFGAVFLLTLAYRVFLITSVYHFTPAISTLLSLNKYFFWWFVAPAIGLFFFVH